MGLKSRFNVAWGVVGGAWLWDCSLGVNVGYRFSLIFIEVLKIAENLEKQSFTFFAFLPPYIGVSGSLVSRMRKISMRSIDWYQKFLISCLAARYSAVFVFFIVKIDFLKFNFRKSIFTIKLTKTAEYRAARHENKNF